MVQQSLASYESEQLRRLLFILKDYQPGEAIIQECLARVLYATLVGNFNIDLRDFRVAWSVILKNPDFAKVMENVIGYGNPQSTHSDLKPIGTL